VIVVRALVNKGAWLTCIPWRFARLAAANAASNRQETNSSSTYTSAFESVLLDRCHNFVTSNEGARPEGGKAGEQRASLQGPKFTVDHRMASIPTLRPQQQRIVRCADGEEPFMS
jgi:hypothetical protein